jgi:hypothetical protein
MGDVLLLWLALTALSSGIVLQVEEESDGSNTGDSHTSVDRFAFAVGAGPFMEGVVGLLIANGSPNPPTGVTGVAWIPFGAQVSGDFSYALSEIVDAGVGAELAAFSPCGVVCFPIPLFFLKATMGLKPFQLPQLPVLVERPELSFRMGPIFAFAPLGMSQGRPLINAGFVAGGRIELPTSDFMGVAVDVDLPVLADFHIGPDGNGGVPLPDDAIVIAFRPEPSATIGIILHF